MDPNNSESLLSDAADARTGTSSPTSNSHVPLPEDLGLPANYPTFIGILPPKDIAKRDRRKIYFGFPIPYSWFDFHLERLQDEGEDTSLMVLLLLYKQQLVSLCREKWPSGPHAAMNMIVVYHGDYGKTCFFLIVGVPGRKPPPEVVKELQDELEDMGIWEFPGWYPKAT